MANYPLISVETTVNGILKITDEATRETHGGKFINYDSQPVPW